MSDESSGAGQSGALPPRDNLTSRPLLDHHPVRIAQVAGTQFVITSHGMPALTQISSTNVQGTTATLSQGGLTRIISLTPSRTNNQSTLRPSVANQNIVNALIKSRPTTVKTQLFANVDSLPATHATIPRLSLKRSSTSSLEDRDSYSAKVRRLIDHRNVKSKIVREKYNEHLMEKYYLETSGNILDLPQFAKRPKTQHFLTYLKENVIDPKEVEEEVETPSTIVKAENQTNTSNNNVVVVATTSSSATVVPSVDSTKVISSTPSAAIKSRPSLNYSVSNNQEQIMEKAKQEAYVVHRVTDLQKDGLWSEKRLPKCQEMPRGKAHWDYLLEEMVWLAADFAQERKWKKAAAKKCAKMVQKYFQDKSLAAQKAEKAQEQHLRRVAAFCAKEVKAFWSNVEKLVDYKQNTRLAEKRKKAMDQQLRFIVDQTEKYSQLLAEGMNKSVANPEALSAPSSIAPSRNNSDDEFQPEDNSSDDEETIAQEEARIDEKGQTEEVAALQRESEMDIDTFLSELPKDYLENRTKITLSDGNDSDDDEDENEEQQDRSLKDEDFVIDSSGEEDDEDTIQEQEMKEGKLDHKDELNDLKAENELSVEELRKKYANLQSVPADNVSSDSDYEESSSDESNKDEDDTSDKSEFSDVNMSLSDEDEENQSNEIGLKSLLDDSGAQNEGDLKKTDNQDLIDDAAAIAESIQPKGNTLSSTSVVTPIPFLLKYTLREYQHIGLDWLVTMYERKLNGILADEMGLGKTIQTIALLAHLACEKANWGPHLIIVPTSVMLNWEMECKKWCPAFKILTYYGTQKERKQKRMGWTKPNAFHVCITSYKLVIQDHQSFRRKKWKYLILDEAQNIKNFKSQRWQLLLNFATQQRLLLTGTPLQNNLMELWSLMHFLMPNVFQSHREFKEWFSNPVTGMIEGNSEYNESIIKRLHKVLRPFLLRRLKCEVEKQMPKKYEHVVMCRLSKRQRFLYDDYMSRAKTKETLASGNLLSVINILMQLRKVCNHPNLFEVRPTTSPFQCDGINWHIPSLVYSALKYDVWKHIDLYSMNLNLILMEMHLNAYQCYRMRQYQTPRKLIEEINSIEDPPPSCPPAKLVMHVHKLKPQPSEAKVDSATPMPALEAIKPNTNINLQTNIKFKIAPHQNLLHFVQQNPLKVFHPGGNQVNSVLKSEKVLFQPGVAQLVNMASGQHLLITPTSSTNLTNNSIVTTGGQRVTLLSSKQVITTSQGTNITKSLPKMQVVSIPTSLTTSTSSVTKNVVANLMKVEEDKETGKKTIGNKFISRLYSNQPHDVRWRNQKVSSPKKHHRHSVNEGEEIQIKDYQKNKLELIGRINERRCSAVPLYGKDFHDSIKVFKNSENAVWSAGRINCLNTLYNMNNSDITDCLQEILYTPEERIDQLKEVFDRFIFYVPAVQAPEPKLQIWHPDPSSYWGEKQNLDILTKCYSKPATCLHPIASAMITQFPDPRLIQYDCGKLQTLDKLLRRLKYEGHRVLIFTQMTKMLDVLEVFLNFHGHIYLRLDGSTKVDQRQILMERFNGDPRLFAFILSTRSGGIGVNLTGADTVIFYDSDWNPTMDAQAQDRCHRIGQTRDVHIYRLVSERTIEENILKKANQKRLLGDLAIEGGNFTTAYFKSSTIQDLFNIDSTKETAAGRMEEVILINKEREMASVSEPSTSAQVQPTVEDKSAVGALENALAACEDDQDVIAARTAKAEAVADLAEFDENIPLEDQEKEKEPEISKAEQEVENMVKQLTPIERYAMRFIEETEAAWSAEQLAAAEREIDKQKHDWEKNQLAALREEEERRAKELEEEQELITYSREDATNQVSTKNKKLNVVNRVISDKKVNVVGKKLNKRLKPKKVLSEPNEDVRLVKITANKIDDDEILTKDVIEVVKKVEESVKIGKSTSSPKVNGDLDSDEDSTEDSEDEDEGQCLSKFSCITPNHVDHNSPRTRSRGTVSINLWTLDVSPILPGVKPVKNALNSLIRKKLRDQDEDSDDSTEEEEEPQPKKLIKKVGERTKKQPEKNKNVNCDNKNEIQVPTSLPSKLLRRGRSKLNLSGKIRNKMKNVNGKMKKMIRIKRMLRTEMTKKMLRIRKKRLANQNQRSKSVVAPSNIVDDKKVDNQAQDERLAKENVKEFDQASSSSDDEVLLKTKEKILNSNKKLAASSLGRKKVTGDTTKPKKLLRSSKKDVHLSDNKLRGKQNTEKENLKLLENKVRQPKKNSNNSTNHREESNSEEVKETKGDVKLEVDNKESGKKVCHVIVTDILKQTSCLNTTEDSSDISQSSNANSSQNSESNISNIENSKSKQKPSVKSSLQCKYTTKFRNKLSYNTIAKKKLQMIKTRSLRNQQMKNALNKNKRNANNSSSMLKNWLVKLPSGSTEKQIITEGENIALKAEITKVENASELRDSSLKRLCNNDDGSITTSKIIKTA